MFLCSTKQHKSFTLGRKALGRANFRQLLPKTYVITVKCLLRSQCGVTSLPHCRPVELGSHYCLEMGAVFSWFIHSSPPLSLRYNETWREKSEERPEFSRWQKRRKKKQKVRTSIKGNLGEIVLSHLPFPLFVQTETRSQC